MNAVSLLTRTRFSIICKPRNGEINSLLNTTYIVIDSVIDRLAECAVRLCLNEVERRMEVIIDATRRRYLPLGYLHEASIFSLINDRIDATGVGNVNCIVLQREAISIESCRVQIKMKMITRKLFLRILLHYTC